MNILDRFYITTLSEMPVEDIASTMSEDKLEEVASVVKDMALHIVMLEQQLHLGVLH